MVRTPSYDQNGKKKGTWTPEEDRKLAAYVTKYGCSNWRQLPKYAGLARCGKSCRLRWMNYLRPNIKRGNYTKEEDDIILKLHAQLGNRWSTIAGHLPGRSDNEIKNHWHASLKKRSNYYAPNSSDSESKSVNQASGTSRKIVENQNAVSRNNCMRSYEIVLESSQGSTKQSSSEEHQAFQEEAILMENSGSFCTEPFLVDTSFSSKSDYVFPSIDWELVCPPSPLIGHEFLYSFDLED